MAKRNKRLRLLALEQGEGLTVSENIIKGVSVIAKGPAIGHGLMVDNITLMQVANAGNLAKRGIKVGMGHEARITELVGYIKNFRVENDKVIGDLHLLQTSEHTDYVKELATVMPEEFGLSVSIEGENEVLEGISYARCEKLSSVDIVKEPAANRNGLYEQPIQTNENEIMVDNDIMDMTPEEFSTLFATSIAPIQKQMSEIQEALKNQSTGLEATGETASLEATGETASLEATGETASLEATGETGATGTSTDMSAMILAGMKKLFSDAGFKPSVSPANANQTAPEKKNFEALVIDARKSGKGAGAAVLEIKNSHPTEYANYLERCVKESEENQKSTALGIPRKSLVNHKAFATKL